MTETDKLAVSPGRVAVWLSTVAGFLGVAHLLMVYLRRALGYDHVMGIARLFDFYYEANFPSYYSALLLLGAAGLLAMIGCSGDPAARRFRFLWLLLAAIFAYLSCDELLALHERLMLPTRQALHTTGLLYAAWIIPYGIALLVLAAVYWRWFMALPPVTRWRFLVAGGLFLMGAIVLESLSGVEWEAVKTRSLLLDTYIFLEDVFEMAGVIVFIWALLHELARLRVTISFGDAPASS